MECKSIHELAELSKQSGGVITNDNIHMMKTEFCKTCEILHGKIIKKKYNYIKKKLYELNEKLDIFDNSKKNKLDHVKYKALNDINQCRFLIEDIFDNFQPSPLCPYSTEQINEIIGVFELMKDFTEMNIFEDIIYIVKNL